MHFAVFTDAQRLLFRVGFAVFGLIGIGLRNTLALRSVTSAYDYSYYHASLLLSSYVVACWRYIIKLGNSLL